MKDMEEEALKSCLVTRERESMHLRLGLASPSCGSPPFDSAAPDIQLITLPWTEWPIYDPAIFEVERQRIERWYHARGYFDARVKSVQAFADGREVNPDECKADSSCKLEVVVKLTEGKPTLVDEVYIVPEADLPEGLQRSLEKALQLKRGKRFDEASYGADKAMLEARLIAASYARAKVRGTVWVDRNSRKAIVEYRVDPGPTCVFGKVHVEGADDVPVPLILETANLREGATYDQEVVDDAQRAIFALRVFSSVKIERRGEGRVVDLMISLQRGRITNWSAGIGVMSGTLRRTTSTETNSVPQWDVHLKASYENRNLLGGLRSLRLEERPRVIFLRQFPGVPPGGPRYGNLISLTFEQPATFERRTVLFSSAAWDVGPDPYRGFFRHDVAVKLGLRRSFWKRRFTASLAVEQDFYRVLKSERPEGVSSYTLPFLEQLLTIDLRDDARRPRLGAFAQVLVQETSRLGSYGSWDYVRVLPEVRGYVPLLFDVVLAARFAVGALYVFDSEPGLDPNTAGLGPETYRLRGGGPTSNRGFAAGRLGDGLIGGSRRFEGSLELRVPLGGDLGLVFFGDVGDVHTSFRWKHLNTSAGLGLRYFSIIGAIRLDAGWRIPGAQVLGAEPAPAYKGDGWPSAVHLTIGEAF